MPLLRRTKSLARARAQSIPSSVPSELSCAHHATTCVSRHASCILSSLILFAPFHAGSELDNRLLSFQPGARGEGRSGPTMERRHAHTDIAVLSLAGRHLVSVRVPGSATSDLVTGLVAAVLRTPVWTIRLVPLRPHPWQRAHDLTLVRVPVQCIKFASISHMDVQDPHMVVDDILPSIGWSNRLSSQMAFLQLVLTPPRCGGCGVECSHTMEVEALRDLLAGEVHRQFEQLLLQHHLQEILILPGTHSIVAQTGHRERARVWVWVQTLPYIGLDEGLRGSPFCSAACLLRVFPQIVDPPFLGVALPAV